MGDSRSQRLNTVVIPAAGRGTRMSPASLAVPKELMPVFDTPAIHLVVDEAVAAGVERFVVIRSPEKSGIIDYLSNAYGNLHHKNYSTEFELVDVVQAEPLGLGSAILEVEHIIGEGRFSVMLPDGLYLGEGGGLGELLKIAERIEGNLVTLKRATSEELATSGAVAATRIGENLFSIDELIEKPNSNIDRYEFMILGRYILEPSIFSYLKMTAPSITGEIELTDALALASATIPIKGATISGSFHDVGTPLGLLNASLTRARLMGQYSSH